MTEPREPTTLVEFLDRVYEAAPEGDQVSLGAVHEVVGRRSFGPLLLVAVRRPQQGPKAAQRSAPAGGASGPVPGAAYRAFRCTGWDTFRSRMLIISTNTEKPMAK